MQKLLDFIDSDNIAEKLDIDELTLIAQQVIEQYTTDWDSMTEYREVTDEGLKLSKPDIHPRTTPWAGSANYKSTAMISASVGFGDRATLELLSKSKDLFLMDIIGKDDEQKTKKAKALRIQAYENHCLQYEMGDWVESQSALLYTLPAYGTVFKKVYYDPMLRRKVSSTINYPNFAINQAAKSLETCVAFTEKHCYSKNQAAEFIQAGWWSEITLSDDDPSSNDDTNEIYIEQHCYLDLDEDGYKEPYIVTVHQGSAQVCRIVAAYDKEDVVFKNGSVISNLAEAERLGALSEVVSTGKVVKIVRRMNIVKYGFIKSVNGDFLDVGFYYLLSPASGLINSITNLLLNSGSLSVLPSGFLSREHRQRKGSMNLKPGEFRQTDIPAQSLANSIQKLPVGELSQSLMVMNTETKNDLNQFAASLDLEGLLGSHVSATSALVAAQEALIPHSAIMNNILRAQTKEFDLLYRLTPEYLTDEEYSMIVGEQASVDADYDSSAVLKPTAQHTLNNVVVETYRIEALMSQIPTILQAGGNVIPIIKSYVENVGGSDFADIFQPMTEEEQRAKSEQMMIAQKKEAQLQDLNIAIAQGQVEAFKAEQTAAQMKQENERAKLMSEIEEAKAKEHVSMAQASKLQAEAEAQYIENQLVATGVGQAILDKAEAEVEEDMGEFSDAETPEVS